MIQKIKFWSVLGAMFGIACGSAYGAELFSQYGQIQNVPGYSLNPANKYGTAYNQKFPQAIYVQGPELTAADCLQTVSALVASYCSGINDCSGVSLSDARPALMVQLSRMPGHNYASACGGYIDTAFNDYMKNYSGTVNMNRFVAFPDAIGGTVSQPVMNIKIKEHEVPQWQQEYIEREQELQNLQSQNGVGTERLAKEDFPKTFSDLSFAERNTILAQGYEPYKDKSAYVQLNIESYEEYLNRLKGTDLKKWCEITKSPECEERVVVGGDIDDEGDDEGGDLVLAGGSASDISALLDEVRVLLAGAEE